MGLEVVLLAAVDQLLFVVCLRVCTASVPATVSGKRAPRFTFGSLVMILQ